MKEITKTISVLVALLLSSQGFAQIANLGEWYISPGTQVSIITALDNKASGDLINDGALIVYDDFNNDGFVSFMPKTFGTVFFSGTLKNQKITGSMPLDLNNVQFNNSSATPDFIVTNQINVSSNADFVNGIIKNDANSLFVFNTEATFSNPSNQSYIEGKAKKIGNTAFSFPIGARGNYVYATIPSSSSLKNAYQSQYFFENSNTIAPHTNLASNIEFVDHQQYWKIEKEPSSDDVTLTLSLHENTTPTEITTASAESIHILGWDHVQKSWIDLGGKFDDITNEVSTTTKALGLCSLFTFAKINNDNFVVKPYQLVSANGDGKNDFFYIEGIEKTTENTLHIFNRWGINVYSKVNYNNNPEDSFKGFSTANGTINKGHILPEGVYFYILTYKDKNGNQKQIKSYLYLKE